MVISDLIAVHVDIMNCNVSMLEAGIYEGQYVLIRISCQNQRLFNLVREELYDAFIKTAVDEFKAKFGHAPKVYDVVISDGARKVE